MSAQHHYVSQFHLRQFLDIDSLAHRDPWLWQGRIADGAVKRRAPKNVGAERLLFDGPGGLRDRSATLESFLAATRKRFGQGTVVKLGFWPKDDSFLALVESLVPVRAGLLSAPCPDGVLAVPRIDNSLFIINTTGAPQKITTSRVTTDRLSGKDFSAKSTMAGYEVLWLE